MYFYIHFCPYFFYIYTHTFIATLVTSHLRAKTHIWWHRLSLSPRRFANVALNVKKRTYEQTFVTFGPLYIGTSIENIEPKPKEKALFSEWETFVILILISDMSLIFYWTKFKLVTEFILISLGTALPDTLLGNFSKANATWGDNRDTFGIHFSQSAAFLQLK